MIRPEALKKNVPLKWSPGLGAEVWDLFCACINGDVRTVRRLLKNDPSLVRCHHGYRTPAAVFAANPALADDPEALANAAAEGQVAFVRLMLRHQPDLPRRITFPPWSVGGKTRELNEILFEHGMSPSQPDWLLITPLHQFARTGDVEKAELFIDQGADLHARDEDICSTPLGWAAKFGQRRMVELLLGHGARSSLPDDPAWATPLAWATRRGHSDIVQLLKQHGET